MTSFSTAFLVDQSPEEAFAAIADVRAWWSGEIEGRTDKLDAEFTHRYENLHFSKTTHHRVLPAREGLLAGDRRVDQLH